MSAGNSILSDLGGYADRVARLFQLDAILLSIETKQNLRSIATTAAMFAVAAGLAFLGLVVLLFAIVLALVELGLAPSLAALVVAAVLLAVAAGLALVAMGRIRNWSLTPRRTLSQFRQNIETLRASLRNEPSTNG